MLWMSSRLVSGLCSRSKEQSLSKAQPNCPDKPASLLTALPDIQAELRVSVLDDSVWLSVPESVESVDLIVFGCVPLEHI